MKKSFLLISLILGLSAAPLCAFENGPYFGAGLDASIIKPYFYESASYRFKWDTGLGVDVGLRAMENILVTPGEPIVYLAPDVNFYYKYFYLGGGLLINTKAEDPDELTFVIRTGAALDDLWEWGPGKGGLDLGFEFSPTVYLVEAEDGSASSGIGAALGTVFLTLINMFKLNVGVTYYLPVGNVLTPAPVL